MRCDLTEKCAAKFLFESRLPFPVERSTQELLRAAKYLLKTLVDKTKKASSEFFHPIAHNDVMHVLMYVASVGLFFHACT